MEPPEKKTAEAFKQAPATTGDQRVDIKTELLSGLTFYLHPAGIIKSRRDLIEGQITSRGGKILQCLPDSANEDIADNDSGKFIVLIEDDVIDKKGIRKLIDKLIAESTSLATVTADFVAVRWLSACLKEKKLLDKTKYLLPERSVASPADLRVGISGYSSRKKRSLEPATVSKKESYSGPKRPRGRPRKRKLQDILEQ